MRPALLVGRARERAAVERAFDDLAAGRGRALAFVGAPGIGKTTLLDEVATAGTSRSAAVAWGVAWDGAGAPVFWPLIQVLRALAARAPAGVSELLAQAAGRLSSSGAPADLARDPADARAASFDRVVSALLGLNRPATLLFDDLHAADAATLELLVACLRATRGAPILWVFAWRDVEVGDRPEAARRALAALRREVEPLAPSPLAAEEIARLAEAEIGGALDGGALQALHQRTLGNPLFVVEILRHGAGSVLPETVREAWATRLERLPQGERALIDAAAILGDELRLPALSALLGAGPEATLAQLALPVRLGLLVDGGGTRLRFGHPLVRETTLAELAPAARSALHRRAAEALRSLARSGSSIPASAIAHHLLSAQPLIDPELTFSAVRQAAAAAMRLGADLDAAALLARAVEALDGSGPIHLDALVLHAEASIRAGRRAEGLAGADRAIALAREAGDATRLARAALARGFELQIAVIDRALLAALEEALARLPDEATPLRARVLARLAAARQPAPDWRAPVAMALEAVRMAEAVAGPEDLAVVLFNAGSTVADFAPPAERRVIDLRTFEVARSVGERVFAIRAAARLLMDHLELGEVEVAERWGRELGALVSEVKSSRWRWLPHVVDALFLAARGELKRALEENTAAVAVAAEIEDPWGSQVALSQRLYLLRDGGTAAELEAHAGPLIARMGALENQFVGRIIIAGLRAVVGDPAPVRAGIESLALDPRFAAVPVLLLDLGRALALLGDRTRAEEMLSISGANDRDWAIRSMLGFYLEGPVAHGKGLLLLAAGRVAEAIDSLDAARAECRARGLRTAAAHIEHERARVLFLVGRADEGRAAASAARAEAEAIGMPLLLAALARLPEAPRSEIRLSSEAEAPLFQLTLADRTWRLTYAGRVHLLREQRGLGMLARLLARPDEELHALELMDAGEEADPGDAGEVLDEEAKRQYQRRLRELESELAAAEASLDPDRREHLLEERDALARELSRGFGLGGRTRRAGAAAERARVNVQRRLKDAIRRIAEVEPALGGHLESAVSTGLFCAYRPKSRRRDAPG